MRLEGAVVEAKRHYEEDVAISRPTMMTTWTKVITVEMERERQNLESFREQRNHFYKSWPDSSILLINVQESYKCEH